MAFRREAALCYGTAGKYLILGGENANFQLFGRTVTESYASLGVQAGFRTHVIQATEAARATERRKLKYLVEAALNQYSGNLTLGVRTRDEGTGQILFTPTVTATDPAETARVIGQASISFTSSTLSADSTYIGDLLSIEGVGTFYITNVTGGGTYALTLQGPDLGPITTLTGGSTVYNCRVLQSVVKADEGDWYGPYHARPSVSEAPDGNDNPDRTTYSFGVSFLRPAVDSRDVGRLEAGASCVIDASSRQTVAFVGQYTGYNGNNSLAQYQSVAKSWAASLLSSDYTGDFELLGEEFNYDDEKAALTFSLAYQEILLPETSGGSNRNDIKNATMVMTRRTNSGGRGLPDRAPVFADVNYSCSVDKTITTHTGLVSLYEQTVLPLIIAQIKAKFGANEVYINAEFPTFDTTGNAISVYISAYLSGVGSSVVEFARTISYQLNMDRALRKRLNGAKQQYRSSSAFPDIVAEVNTVEVREGTPTLLPSRAIENSGYLPRVPSTYQVIGEPSGLLFDPPGGPPFGSAVSTDATWNLMGSSVDVTQTYSGNYSADATPLLLSVTNVSTAWLWGDVENQPAAGGGSTGSTELESQLSGGGDGQEGFIGFTRDLSPFAPPAQLSEDAVGGSVPDIMTSPPS